MGLWRTHWRYGSQKKERSEINTIISYFGSCNYMQSSSGTVYVIVMFEVKFCDLKTKRICTVVFMRRLYGERTVGDIR